METSLNLGPSPFQGAPSSRPKNSEVVYLRNELDVDLWFKGDTSDVQSVLIRATTPDGVTRSSFMHIDGAVQQIPVFNNADPLTISETHGANQAESSHRKTREFTWTPQRKRDGSFTSRAMKIAAAVVALVFFASALTGFMQLRVVLTGSMKPAINPGDLVIAIKPSAVKPHVGKVVLYSARDLQGNAVTVWSHRIIAGNSKKGFIIKGDANSQPDIGTIPITDIQSVVILRVPFIGHLFNIYSLLMIFGGLMLISMASSRRKRE
jgi:signal peptidase I